MRLRLSGIAKLAATSINVAAEPQTKPNVVIVLVDDFGWGDPSCDSKKMVQTPNIERIANESARFTQGYVAAPICAPLRCGIVTGNFPSKWRITSCLQAKAGNKACGWPLR